MDKNIPNVRNGNPTMFSTGCSDTAHRFLLSRAPRRSTRQGRQGKVLKLATDLEQ